MLNQEVADKLKQEFTSTLDRQLSQGWKLKRRNFHGCLFSCWLNDRGIKDFDVGQLHVFFFIRKHLGLSSSQISAIICGWDRGFRSPYIDLVCYDLGKELSQRYLGDNG